MATPGRLPDAGPVAVAVIVVPAAVTSRPQAAGARNRTLRPRIPGCQPSGSQCEGV